MNDEDQLDGEVSRAITLGGMSFTSQLASDPEQHRQLRVYSLPFQDPSEAKPFTIVAYLARPFFVVTCGMQLAEGASLETLSEALYRQVPMVRLIKAVSVTPPGTKIAGRNFWVEATSVVHPGPWSAEAHLLAAVPIQIVSNAVRLLLTAFRSEVEVSGIAAPFMDVSLTPAAANAG
jgi:hypothetical protein